MSIGDHLRAKALICLKFILILVAVKLLNDLLIENFHSYIQISLGPFFWMLTGFFFGVRRSIDRAAHNVSAGHLFNPKTRILGQEADLYNRMKRVVRTTAKHKIERQMHTTYETELPGGVYKDVSNNLCNSSLSVRYFMSTR